MPDLSPFEYAIVRVVPHVEREEFINAGVIVFSPDNDVLVSRIALDEPRLLAIAPDVDLPLVRAHLQAIPVVCGGGRAAGPIGALSTRERWRWLVSPRSTILQTSAPHAGMCADPAALAEALLERVVLVRSANLGA